MGKFHYNIFIIVDRKIVHSKTFHFSPPFFGALSLNLFQASSCLT